MNGNYQELPPAGEGQPPHPEFCLKKWPSPRFGKKEPDQLLENFMEWNEIGKFDFYFKILSLGGSSSSSFCIISSPVSPPMKGTSLARIMNKV